MYCNVLEAEYAYKLSKPIFPLLLQDDYVPDGWLGAFVGVQFYMKITDSQSIDDSNLDELVTKLRSKMSSQSRDEFQMMSSGNLIKSFNVAVLEVVIASFYLCKLFHIFYVFSSLYSVSE